MSGSTRTSADLDARRRKILFRAWHRGIREMDLIMGRFVDAEIGTLADGEIGELEGLLEVPDADLYRWISGEAGTPSNYDTPIFRRIRAFHTHGAPIHS
jgi:antitoxin CptB